MPRVKPHFKVHLSLANHAKTAEMFQDNDLLATWLRLGMLAIERRGARTADVFLVGDKELQGVTGKGRVDVARKLVARLADVSPMSASRHGDVWRIEFPKLSEKQGFGPKNGRPPNTEYLDKKEVPKEPLVDPPEKAESTKGEIGKTPTITDGEKTPDSRGSPQSDDPPPVRPSTRRGDVLRQWRACVQAAAKYGKQWSEKPSARRVAMMAARLRDFPSANPDVLVRVVHGAAKSWNRDEEAIGKWLRPETVYRRSNFEKYIEAFNEPEIPATPQRRETSARDNTVRGAVERLGDRYGITGRDESQVVDVRASGERVPDE